MENKKQELLKDKKTGKLAWLTDTTSNTFYVTRKRTNSKGIDCSDWFEKKEFNKRFLFVL